MRSPSLKPMSPPHYPMGYTGKLPSASQQSTESYCPPPQRVPAELQWSKQGYKWLLLTACSCTLHSLRLFFFLSSLTHKRPPSNRCCAFMTGLAAPPHRPSGARGFHSWDSQRSVMNIHVWSAVGKIPGEIERARKMNIELTCWAGRGLHSQLPSHNVLCC